MITGEQLQSYLTSKPITRTHSQECQLVGEYKLMSSLNEIEQDYVLRCHHVDHESVRMLYGFLPKLISGQLVRKM